MYVSGRLAMSRLVAVVALIGLAAPVAAQNLPKVRLPTRLPTNVPGATELRSAPKTPGQAISRVRRDEVQDLMKEALASDDPEEQARIYTKILLIDPNNTVAFQGRKDALAKIEQQQSEEFERSEQENVLIEQSLQAEQVRRTSVKNAEDAFMRGDIDTAELEIEKAKAVAPDDTEVQRMDLLIQDRLAARRRTNYILIGVGIVALIGLIAFIIIRMRRRDPYVEIIAGQQKGKIIPVDGKLLKIGAVEQDGGDKNDVALPDVERMISRFHCEIHRRGRKLFLIDVGSANGTFLEKKQLEPGKPFPLKRGSRIDLAGTCALRVGYERRKK
ncbi:MAG TPA: FHA domain-containing protein [Bryobacterales bacterium]|nr:FHA domain-containing protein [Bryobacterales bacterium]